MRIESGLLKPCFFVVYLVFLITVYKIIDKYINFNSISFKISININNNSIYYNII